MSENTRKPHSRGYRAMPLCACSKDLSEAPATPMGARTKMLPLCLLCYPKFLCSGESQISTDSSLWKLLTASTLSKKIWELLVELCVLPVTQHVFSQVPRGQNTGSCIDLKSNGSHTTTPKAENDPIIH